MSSNTTLLVDTANADRWTVHDALSSVWDLEPIKGDLNALWRLMDRRYPRHPDGVKWDQIADIVQASDDEILSALRAKHALFIDGTDEFSDKSNYYVLDSWHLLDEAFVLEVLKWIFLEWRGDGVDLLGPVRSITDIAVDDARPEIVRHIIHMMTDESGKYLN